MNPLLKRYIGTTRAIVIVLLCCCASGCAQKVAHDDTTMQIERQALVALERLYSESPSAVEMSKVTKGILVFPNVTDIGLIFGGYYGEGAMLVDKKLYGAYSISSAYWGMAVGAQNYSISMFIITEEALELLKNSSSWQFGAALKTVVVNKGTKMSGTMTDDVYVFVYGQKGLVSDFGRLEGIRIRKLDN